MTDYRSDWLSLESTLDGAFLTSSLPQLHDHVVIDPHAPSAVRVLGKSMYVLAAGWILSVAWLWIATLEQHILRRGIAPAHYALETLLAGLLPVIVIASAGIGIDRWAGPAPDKWVNRREWVHAFWWCLVPNLLLLVTVWVMIQEARWYYSADLRPRPTPPGRCGFPRRGPGSSGSQAAGFRPDLAT